MQTRLAVAGAVLMVAAACSKGSGGSAAPTTAAPTTAAPTTAAPTTASSPASTAPPVRTKQVVFGRVTVRVPESWDKFTTTDHGTYAAFGPTIHVKKGYAIARLNVASWTGSIDDLRPQFCSSDGSGPPEAPSAVKVDDSGFAPVGDRTAEYRRWTATCAKGPEEHRAWLLPLSKLAFWEACSDAAITAIVAGATVADPAPDEVLATSTPPSGIRQNCDDSYKTDVTTGR